MTISFWIPRCRLRHDNKNDIDSRIYGNTKGCKEILDFKMSLQGLARAL
ncbi:hypothetical protein [Helicobacter fennelliae]|nr:hypothetical protein [Helicobacter fennelliae]